MFRAAHFIVLCVLITGCALLRAAVSPDEIQKQNDFKKAYKVPDKGDRQKSLQLLDGLADPSTVALLVSVCNTDPDKDVRLDAFRVLSRVKARDGTLAQSLVAIFQQVREPDQKLEYARHFGGSEFKYPIVAALADWASRLRYPDQIKVNPPRVNPNAKTAPPDPNALINKQRDEFAAVFGVFNSVSQANLPGPDKNSPVEVRKWWEANGTKVSAADAELLKKYKAEDQAKKDADKAAADKAAADKPAADKPAADKPAADKPAADKPAADKPPAK